MKQKKLPGRLTVDVLKEDIKRGIQGQPNCCAVARAINRKLKSLGVDGRASVSCGVDINDDDDDTIEVYAETKKLNKFITNFDRDKSSVKPTRISLLLYK